MKKRVVALVFAIIGFCLSSAGQTGFAIYPNISGNIAQYCQSELLLFPALALEGNPTLKGMKVSITEGYLSAEDLLTYDKQNNVTGQWDAVTGSLTLTNGSNLADYQEALRHVSYKNSSTKPTNSTRKVTVTLDDADYLPFTGHFYRFISRTGISWSNAKAEAESDAMMLFGLRGYLATVTSFQENDFIRQKTKGVGWIGASDATAEGYWRWVTGPEGLKESGGLLFWRGTGYQAKKNDPAGVYGPVNSAYHNWNKWDQGFSSSLSEDTWEPNDVGAGSGTENYAHITYFPNDAKNSFKWNDLPDGGGTGDYAAQGYLIEYGGMTGDPTVNLAATIDLQVNTVWFDDKRDFTVCAGQSVNLNRADNTASYFWNPADGLSSPSVANPTATPLTTTSYTVSATRGVCADKANFTVNVNPLPESMLKGVENVCNGSTLTLDPGVHSSYLWSNGATTRTITVDTPGTYSVTLKSEQGCETNSTTQTVYHSYPKLDLSNLQTLICGSKTTLLDVKSDKGDIVVTGNGSNALPNDLNVTVANWGQYSYVIKAEDQYGCAVDTIMDIGFHPIPTVDLTVDESKCYGYNLDASYIGDAQIDISRFIWVFGGDTITNEIGANQQVIPLGINKEQRDLVLTVGQNGCYASASKNDIKVTPYLELSVEDSIGCQPFTAVFDAVNTEKVKSFDWNWGDGQTSQSATGTQPHQYIDDGYYNVSLKVTTDQGCTNWVKVDSMIYTAPIPRIRFSIKADSCLGKGTNSLAFAGNALPEDTYHWELGALDTEEIITDPQTSLGPLVFELKNKPSASIGLHVTSTFGCHSNTSYIEVKRKPDFSFTATPHKGCIPLHVDFSATATDPVDQLDYTWDFGNRTNAIGAMVSSFYQEADSSYSVRLYAKSSVTGCSDSIFSEKHITTFPKPEARFSMDHDIVYNDAPVVQFTNESTGAATYLWDFGDDKSPEENPEYRFSGFGTKTILLTAYNEMNCSDTISDRVTVLFNKIFAPNAFSPNAATPIDRVFKLASSGIKENGYHLVIMSRWNDIVFEAQNAIVGWDGKLKNGQSAPAGTYVWVLKYVDFLDRTHKQSGTVTLVY